MKTPQIVSREEWKTAWQQMLVKEKAHTRAGRIRDFSRHQMSEPTGHCMR
ncbi:MAG: DUF899 domain-containing protein [Mesorhizobium sp.]|nr:DUF899 domain-containing protein [Mesorhizobium sp.]